MNSRTYLVGLPVAITVYDDGTVEYDLDASEASTAIFDDQSEPEKTDAEVAADSARIDYHRDRPGTPFAVIS